MTTIHFLVGFLLLFLFPLVSVAESDSAHIFSVDNIPPDHYVPNSKNAYATLLYNDGVLEGARVLGLSLAKSGTPYERVAIVTPTCSEASIQTLRNDGWIIQMAENFENPHSRSKNSMYQKRLGMVFSKLHIYNLTQYDKVVYLDTDTLVLQNIDELFHCPGFCATVRNAFFNTGVIVLRPDANMFEDLIANSHTLPSYNGGEQGLMNSYFPDFDVKCPMFHEDPATIKRLDGGRCGRLPAYYNGDIGPYFLHNSRWNLPDGKEAPKIIHFTLGPFKPWQWWAYPPMDLFWVWYEYYAQLPPPVPRHSEVTVLISLFMTYVMPLALTVAFFLLYHYTSIIQTINGRISQQLITPLALWTESNNATPVSKQRKHAFLLSNGQEGIEGFEQSVLFMAICFAYSLAISAASVYLSFHWSSEDVFHPFWGWLQCFEWFILLFSTLSTIGFNLAYQTGKRLGQPHQHPTPASTLKTSNSTLPIVNLQSLPCEYSLVNQILHTALKAQQILNSKCENLCNNSSSSSSSPSSSSSSVGSSKYPRQYLLRKTVTFYVILLVYLIACCLDLNQAFPRQLDIKMLHGTFMIIALLLYLIPLMIWLPKCWVIEGRIFSLNSVKDEAFESFWTRPHHQRSRSNNDEDQ